MLDSVTSSVDPNAFDWVFVSFSGGKDSVVVLHKALQVFPKHKVIPIFTDTGEELPETYRYVKWIDENVHPVIRVAQKLVSGTEERSRRTFELIELSHDAPCTKDLGLMHLFTLFEERHEQYPNTPFWPTKGIRYCTKHLKIIPFQKKIRSLVEKSMRDRVLVVLGLRQEESAQRRNTQELGFDPDTGWWEWCPAYDMTTDEVFQYHADHNLPINDVYTFRERSNCVGCPFAKAAEMRRTFLIYPRLLQNYVDMEDRTGMTWGNGISLRDVVYGKASKEREAELLTCNSGYCDV
jgi:3'-phosphoadenosine 5'-phosphosulfate sulfotransferase (PAPS reductase)/FAD synthetase